MGRPLKVLIVEDSEDEALLVLRVLKQGGYEVTSKRVDTAPAMASALEEKDWDIIISDYFMPGFSGPGALAMVRAKDLDLPFIIVSGVVGEEAAVAAMHAGARDYVKKDNLARLVPAVERELAEVEVRRDRRRAEEALRESEERFRLLIERVTDYEIFMLDPGGFIVSWNIGAELSKGYRTEEIIGKHHSIFFTPEDIKKEIPDQELLVAAMAGRYEDEGWRVRKDGSLFWANVVTTSLRDNDGHLRGYLKVVRDITGRKWTEDALRESEERYRIIAETASDAIITIDEESRILFANPAVEKIFGYTQDEATGQPLTMLMPEPLRERHLTGIRRYLETGKRTMSWKTLELPGLHKNGREIPLEISYGDFIKDGKHFFSGIIRDVSDRKKAEREAEYNRMLERFTQELETLVTERTMGLMALTLSDRVRNPASVIRLACKRMIEKEAVSERSRESLQVIADEAGKLETIVKDFQSLLKTKKSMFTYEDINAIVSGILSIIEREALNKGVRLVARLSRRPVKMNVQKDLLSAAVFHLLRNALEATPGGGRITVVTCGDSASITLSVSDTGQGIPEEIIDQIFDPLFSTKAYRYGMGLPLVKQIVSEHMGKIVVKSWIGKGTTFRVKFPMRWM